LLVESKSNSWWLFHVIPALALVILLGIMYPYWENKKLWSGYFVKIIYLQWLLYIVFTAIQLKLVFDTLFSKEHKIKQLEIWVLSVFSGVSIIWISYNIGSYTSYIVGALSFSFVFFLLILFWILKRNKTSLFFEETIKYADKKIDLDEASEFQVKLDDMIKEKELFKNPDLKLADVSKQLHVLPHYLSQFLNDNLGKSFPLFINEYRIEEAKQLLIDEDKYTTEAVGYECGFNSKSTFYTTFKKIVGKTPAAYKKESE
jgi:AraC-like DNA-binding protein